MHRKIKNATKHLRKSTFELKSETVWAYLKASNTKGSNFNPLRNTGYVKTFQSPVPVKAIVQHVTGNSLVAREIGLTNIGAKYLFVKDMDVNTIQIASKIKIDDDFYSPYNKALGGRFVIKKLDLGLTRIMVFKSGNKNGF